MAPISNKEKLRKQAFIDLKEIKNKMSKKNIIQKKQKLNKQ